MKKGMLREILAGNERRRLRLIEACKRRIEALKRAGPLKLEHGDYGAVVIDGAPGRPKSWSGEKLDALARDVAEAKVAYDLASDDEALRYLQKREPWQGIARKTLKNRLAEQRQIASAADQLASAADQLLEQLLAGKSQKIPTRLLVGFGMC
jgi:hypothetical protein